MLGPSKNRPTKKPHRKTKSITTDEDSTDLIVGSSSADWTLLFAARDLAEATAGSATLAAFILEVATRAAPAELAALEGASTGAEDAA